MFAALGLSPTAGAVLHKQRTSDLRHTAMTHVARAAAYSSLTRMRDNRQPITVQRFVRAASGAGEGHKTILITCGFPREPFSLPWACSRRGQDFFASTSSDIQDGGIEQGD